MTHYNLFDIIQDMRKQLTTAAKIRALLKIEGYSFDDIAKICGCTRTNIYHWIKGKYRNQKIGEVICNILDKSEEELRKEYPEN